MEQICPICNRVLGGEIESHHLKPVTFRTRTHSVHNKDNQIVLHRICHQKIHSTFCEHDLLNYYHTIGRIVQHPEIVKFIKWVQKKPIDYYDKNNDTHLRKHKRKR